LAAEDQAAIIQKAKQATALVDVQSREFGSAFCVDPAGLFVTNAHVIKGAVAGGHVSLVLQPGESTQQVIQARIVRSDEKQDLALLSAEGGRDHFVPLELGNAGKLYETASVTAFGFPFGRMLAEQRGATSYPNVTVSMGHVTSLRKLNGELQHIQLDASLNPGNSGGPVLDGTGQVIGIVQAGIYGSGVNLAIPVDKLDTLLESPEVIFEPPGLTTTASHGAVDFQIKVASLGKAKSAPLSVQFILRSETGAERSVTATFDGSVYHAKIVPVLSVAAPTKIQLTAEFADGSLSGWVQNASVRCGTRQIKLADLQRIDLGANPSAALADGSRATGPIGGLESTEIDLGGLVIRADLTKAAVVRFTPPSTGTGPLNYRVTVSRNGKIVANTSGTLAVSAGSVAGTGGLATPTVPSLTGVNLEQDRVEVKLPAMIEDVVVAGGGRFLILPMPKLNKIAVFDVKLAKVTQYLSIPPSEVLVAAGADKLFVVLPEQRIIQRWNLNTLQRELTTTVPVEGTPIGAVMGSASRGPLLMRCTSGGPADTEQLVFIDPNTLRALPAVNLNKLNMILMSRSLHLRASASGEVFGMWASGQSPSGVGVVVLHNNKAEGHYEHTGLGSVVPSSDGQFIFTGGGVLFNQQLRPLSPSGTNVMNGMRGRALIPAEGQGYYVSLPMNRMPVVVRNGRQSEQQPASLYLVGNDQPLTTLPPLDELAALPQEQWTSNDFTVDKRVHFFPTANLLITVPTSNDSLILRKFNVIDALDRSGIDYLFVNSTPITGARKGEGYRYPLEVKSKRGGVSFKIESGPEGMSISPTGVLTWQIPRDAADSTVIVTIRDASGQEIFHTFTIAFPEVASTPDSWTPPSRYTDSPSTHIIPARP
jgi:S1-C subfamily serine protease